MRAAATKPQRSLPLESYPLRMRAGQVAAYLNVSTDHVIDLIRTGGLPAVNVGAGSKRGCYRVTREAVAEFEKERKS